MLYFWLVILILLNSVWLMLVPFALPGNWLIVTTTTIFAWWFWDDKVFSIYTLLMILIFALLGELFEFFGGFGGAKKAGAGFRGSLGALIGAITGAIIGTFAIPVPIVGTLAGSSLGAGIGVCLFELLSERPSKSSTRLAIAAGLGQLFGSSIKIVFGVLIWVVVAIAAFWP